MTVGEPELENARAGTTKAEPVGRRVFENAGAYEVCCRWASRDSTSCRRNAGSW